MIGKIQPANPNVISAVEYNERKARGGRAVRLHEQDKELLPIEDGCILATRNVPDDSTLLGEFEKLRINRIKTGIKFKNNAFHMSINPSETDTPLSDEMAVELIDELMETLGYGKQPYRVYKHTDIERLHYHVVSCRSNPDGKKVNDSFERLVLRTALMKLAPKYGYTMVLNEKEKAALREQTVVAGPELRSVPQKSNEPSVQATKTNGRNGERSGQDAPRPKPAFVPAFSRNSEAGVTEQFKAAFNDAMLWHFSTFEQIQALMLRRYNILMEVERTTSDDERIIVSGTNSVGNPVTPPMNLEVELGINLLRKINEKIEKENMYVRKDQRKHLHMLTRAAAEKCDSWEEFTALMERKGTYVVVSWTREGEPFGVTYIDRATRCIWKGSETKVDINWLRETAMEKGWTMEKDKYQKVVDKRSSMPSRKRTISTVIVVNKDDTSSTTQRNTRPGLSGVLSAIRPSGHHRDGASHIGGKGGDIWDDALAAAARDEKERKEAEIKQTM